MRVDETRLALGCPFNKFKPCKERWQDCAFKEENYRKFDVGEEVVIKGCSLYFNSEKQNNVSQRLAMLQAEMGETKTAARWQAAAILTDSFVAKKELAKIARKQLQTPMLLGEEEKDESTENN
jgi:sarcosine oxidase delta subunit